jgi:diguanylate cyclase (GGDEF)-like protein
VALPALAQPQWAPAGKSRHACERADWNHGLRIGVGATTIDDLTGLANRRELDRRLGSMPRRARYSLLAIDIDKLKSMNDTLGHAAGDELIQTVAAALKHATRRGDVAARVGGDAFCVLLSDADSQHAEAVAARILAELERSRIRDRQPSISTGIADFDSGEEAAARLAAAEAIVVQLQQEHFSRLVIDVADPDVTIATIRAAIAGQTRSVA